MISRPLIMALLLLTSYSLHAETNSLHAETNDNDTMSIITGGLAGLEGLKSNLPVPTNVNTKSVTIAGTLGIIGFLGYNFATKISNVQILSQALRYICLGQVLPDDLLRSLSVLLAFSGGCTLYETGPELRRQLISSILTALMWEQFNNPNKAEPNECLKIVLKAISGVGAIQVAMQHSAIVAEFFERVRTKQRAIQLRSQSLELRNKTV